MQIESRHRWFSEGEGSVTSSDITVNTGYERKRLHAFYLVGGTRCLDSIHQSVVSRALCHSEADGLGRGVAEGDQLVWEKSSTHDS